MRARKWITTDANKMNGINISDYRITPLTTFDDVLKWDRRKFKTFSLLDKGNRYLYVSLNPKDREELGIQEFAYDFKKKECFLTITGMIHKDDSRSAVNMYREEVSAYKEKMIDEFLINTFGTPKDIELSWAKISHSFHHDPSIVDTPVCNGLLVQFA